MKNTASFLPLTVLLLGGSASSMFAQPKGKEIRHLAVPVDYVDCEGPVSPCWVHFGILEIGEIPKGTPVTVRTTYNEENKVPRDILTAKTTEIHFDDVSLPIPYEQVESIPEGCIAVTDVLAPVMGYKGIFTDLADQAILFQTVTEESFFDRSELGYLDSPTWETGIIRKMVDDIRYTGKEMRGSMDPYPLKGGIFDGQELLDAMEQTEDHHVRSFLGYVLMRPNIYMGRKWKVSEVYATWLAEATPMFSKLYTDQLFDLRENGEELAIGPIVSKMESNEAHEVVRYNLMQAHYWGVESEMDKARRHLEMAETVARRINDEERIADVMMEWGIFHQWNDEPAQSIDPLNEAIKLYERKGRLGLKVHAMNELGKSYLLLGNEKQVFRVSRKAMSLNDKWGEMMWDVQDDYQQNAASLWHIQARACMENEQMEKAEILFWNAMDHLEQTEVVKGLFWQSVVYSDLALVSKRLGNKETETEYSQESKRKREQFDEEQKKYRNL